MAKLTQLSEVGIYSKNTKLAKDFYTRKIGLKVRSSMPKIGYLNLGATKGGADAGLSIWQPIPGWGEELYRERLKLVGTVAGISFSTGNLEKTVQDLSRKGVKIETQQEGFARFWDPDGNVLFITEMGRPKVRRSGVQKLEWITVVTRDGEKSGAFFQTLGLKKRTERGSDGETYTHYRLSPQGTSIMPFTPTHEMYTDPSDYDADMAHIGEDTAIGFEVEDRKSVV